ncbi:hypothetical protein [Parapedobacter soli]|uniref:hypothetical protein n=1 Tax=Parapedobacter soli TaxID=416955 RepID=UPI0021C6340B|nr:hypothetical protein [Parapedobacter soli]
MERSDIPKAKRIGKANSKKAMNKTTKTVGLPETDKATLYDRIKETLAVASQLVIASPVTLPPKVVAVARYLALALGVLEAVESGVRNEEGEDDENE